VGSKRRRRCDHHRRVHRMLQGEIDVGGGDMTIPMVGSIHEAVGASTDWGHMFVPCTNERSGFQMMS